MYKILLQMNQPTKKKLHHENVNLIYAKHYNSMTRYIMKKKNSPNVPTNKRCNILLISHNLTQVCLYIIYNMFVCLDPLKQIV